MDGTSMAAVWKAILGTGWLDVGNGWRNLFLASCLVQAGALGTAFALRGRFTPQSRVACFLTGASATPLCQYLWMLGMGLLWPRAPRLLLIGVPPLLGGLYLLGLFLRHFRRLPAHAARGRAFLARLIRFDRPGLCSLCFALALAILLLPSCVRFMSSMNAASAGDSGEYMGLALRYCEDRDLGKLLEKEETEGHFRGHAHFPSLELYMSYGLLHTGGEAGYPNDKPLMTAVGLLNLYMLAAFFALLLVLTREKKRWILLGALLWNLAPNLYYSMSGAPRDIWRIAALLLATLYLAGLRPAEGKGWRVYGLKLLWAFALCFTVMSAHVVCFVVLPFLVAAWALYRGYAVLAEGGKALGELAAALGVAFAGALGTLLGFAGNLWCFFRWGEMSPWRLMTTYQSAPWYEAYMLSEYKLEETTTRLDFWQSRYDIVMTYATPIGLWGMRLAALTLLLAAAHLLWRRRKAAPLAAGQTRAAAPVVFAALCTLCTLAPMSGLLDTRLYSFSGAFLALQRYTLQWYLLAAVMICAALAALEGLWPRLWDWVSAKWGMLTGGAFAGARGAALIRPLAGIPAPGWGRRLPALLAALLCGIAFLQGTNQTGYSKSFYRLSRGVMEDDATLLDTGFLERYGLLMVAARHAPREGKILLTRAGYQYPLRGEGYILTANPIVPLMNLPLEEVPQALSDMGVTLLATEPDFWDQRYYALSDLSAYLNALPPEQILQDGDAMRLYILDPALAAEISREIGEAAAY